MFTLLFSLILWPVYLCGQGNIAVVPESEFSESAVWIQMGTSGEPPPLAREGAPASRLLQAWGIFFQSPSTAAQPTLVVRDMNAGYPHPSPPNFVYSVENTPDPQTSSAGKPLIVNFAHPAKRVGFLLWPSEAGEAKIGIFAPDGRKLGDVAGPIVTGERELLTGIEAVGDEIGKVVIDYGDSPLPEKIDAILVDFVRPLVFRTYIPQFAAGPLPPGSLGVSGYLQSSIVLLNPGNTRVRGTLKVKTSAGQPLALDFKEGTGDTFDFLLYSSPPSRSFVTSQTGDQVTSGYIEIVSAAPVKATCLYLVEGSTLTVPPEAGILSEEPKNAFVMPVEYRPQDGIQSAFAVVNPGADPAELRVTLAPGPGAPTKELTLPPGGHTALFVDVLFGLSENYQGSLILRSNRPVAAAALRTRNGVVSASLPVASLEK